MHAFKVYHTQNSRVRLKKLSDITCMFSKLEGILAAGYLTEANFAADTSMNGSMGVCQSNHIVTSEVL